MLNRTVAAIIFVVFSVLISAGQTDAQGLGSLFPGSQVDQTTGTPLAQALSQAAGEGNAVVVLDADGNIVAQVAARDTGPVPAQVDQHSALMNAQATADALRDALLARLAQLPAAINEVLYILRAASPDGTIMLFVKALVLSLALFGIGVVVEREVFAKRFARRFVVARVQKDPKGYAEKMPFLVFRFFTGVAGILVSMAVAYVIGALLFPPLDDTAMQFTVTLINVGYFVCRLVAGLWRMILSPFLSQYRIPIFSDRDAKRLHRWLWVMASFDACAILFGIWLSELGLNYDIYALVTGLLSAAVVLLNILLVLVNRRAVSNALRHGKPMAYCSALSRFLSRAWAPAVIVYVIFAWFELTYDLILEIPSSIPLIAGGYGVLMSIIIVYGAINYLIERSFARARAIRLLRARQAEEERAGHAHSRARAQAEQVLRQDGTDPGADAQEAAPNRATALDTAPDTSDSTAAEQVIATPERDLPAPALNSFEALARRAAGILAFVAGTYAFFYIWDNDSTEMVETAADRLLDVMAVIFIGYIVYHAFRIWIDTKIAEEAGDEPEDEEEFGGEGGGASSVSRLATLLPLFRNFVLILVIVTVGLIVLMEFGINVGPLFAGAGIVGVAVGFGSQALVRDIFAGAFFLFDDAFRKGEYLDVGGVKGTVEKISVRSFQLRHHLGALHTIPFGELQVMTNYSRDWVIMKLPLRVTYDTDVEKVRKLIKKLGIALLDDPVIGENFIQPLKSQGVIEMQDSAMIIRVKFMTKPGDQWLVRKRVYEEIRALFEREGIKFAHREVTVRLADGPVGDLSEDQKRKIAAAAHASLDQDEDGAATPETTDDR